MKNKFLNSFIIIALVLVAFIAYNKFKLSQNSHFTVTADTVIKPGSEISKYITQEEVDTFLLGIGILVTQMQVQNLQSLKNYDWKDLGTILYQTRNVMSKVQGISYDLGNVSRVFEETYKNSSQYKDIFKNSPNEKSRNEAYSKQYDEILAKNQNTFKGTLQKLELMESDFDNETKIIAKLKQRSQNSKGALEVAQAGNDLIAYQIDETRKLRKVMMDQSNMMTNYMASQNNKEMMNKAVSEKLRAGKNDWEGKSRPDIYQKF